METSLRKARSRSGSLLILVLVIMAVGIILITSALSITVAARSRYYNTALSSQSRLTATSVAKTIGAAVIAGDITDTQIEALANASAEVSVTVAASATSGAGSTNSNAIAPGLKGNVGTSYTKAVFTNYPNNTIKTYIEVTVTTYLDAGAATDQAIDSVSVFLKKKPPVDAGAFSSLALFGGSNSNINLQRVDIGSTVGYPNPVNSNLVVVHGIVDVAAGGDQDIYSDTVITGKLTFHGDSHFYGNVILFDNSASIVPPSSGSMYFMKNLIANGTAASPVKSMFTDIAGNDVVLTSGSPIHIGASIFLENRSLTLNPDWNRISDAGLGKPYVISYDGSVVNTGSYSPSDATYIKSAGGQLTINGTAQGTSSNAIIATTKAIADSYKTATITSSVNRQIPTSAQAFALLGIADVPGTTTVTGLGAQQITGLYGASSERIFSASTNSKYFIDTNIDTKLGTGNNNNCMTLTFDLTNGPIDLYIIGSSGNTLNVSQGLIRFINGTNNIGRIILLDKVDISIGSSSGYPFDTGIIGAKHTAETGGPNITKTDYVLGTKPYLYIYGTRANTLFVGQMACIEGYIGLYGYGATDGGSLTIANKPKFYGRIESYGYVFSGSGDMATIPYCPSPSDSSSGGSGDPSSYLLSGYVTS